MKTKKQEWKKAGCFMYSQFIYVDVKPKNQKAKYVKGCKEQDFKKWLLEKKNIGIESLDYWKAGNKITELLKEYLKMNFCGWIIPCELVNENEVLIKTNEDEYILNVETNEKRGFELK